MATRPIGQGSGRDRRSVQAMRDNIDLSPIMPHLEATEMLLLARAQLNQAFRKCGLVPPDPLPALAGSGADDAMSDGQKACDLGLARAHHRAAFDLWTVRIPLWLVPPVMDILNATHDALRAQGGPPEAMTAVRTACDFLLNCLQPRPKRHLLH